MNMELKDLSETEIELEIKLLDRRVFCNVERIIAFRAVELFTKIEIDLCNKKNDEIIIKVHELEIELRRRDYKK